MQRVRNAFPKADSLPARQLPLAYEIRFHCCADLEKHFHTIRQAFVCLGVRRVGFIAFCSAFSHIHNATLIRQLLNTFVKPKSWPKSVCGLKNSLFPVDFHLCSLRCCCCLLCCGFCCCCCGNSCPSICALLLVALAAAPGPAPTPAPWLLFNVFAQQTFGTLCQ